MCFIIIHLYHRGKPFLSTRVQRLSPVIFVFLLTEYMHFHRHIDYQFLSVILFLAVLLGLFFISVNILSWLPQIPNNLSLSLILYSRKIQ